MSGKGRPDVVVKRPHSPECVLRDAPAPWVYLPGSDIYRKRCIPDVEWLARDGSARGTGYRWQPWICNSYKCTGLALVSEAWVARLVAEAVRRGEK